MKVDPIVFGIIFTALPFLFVIYVIKRDKNARTAFKGLDNVTKRDKWQGNLSTATINAVRPTNTRYGREPVVELDLSVKRIDGSVYDITIKDVVPVAQLSLVQVGMVVNVKYNPNKLEQVALIL